MTVPVIVAGVITAAEAAPEIIDAIKRALDALGFDRSCIIEIVNTTDERLRLSRSGHSSGTFERPPAPFLEPHQSVVCAARNTAAGRGAVGNIGYSGDGFNLLIDYSNPAVGANDLDASTEGVRAGEFRTLAENGAGNTNAHFRCVLYYTDPDRYLYGPAFKTWRAANFPDRFIRHRDFKLYLEPDEHNDDFRFDLVVRSRGTDGKPDVVGIRSVNFPDRYLRHKSFELVLEPPSGPGDYLWSQDSSFHLEPGRNSDTVSFSFRSVNYPDRYIRHRNFRLLLEPINTDVDRADASFKRL